MEEIYNSLSAHPFFDDIKYMYIAQLAECATEVNFDVEKFIFSTGSLADKFYILSEGVVALQVHTSQKGSVTIQTLNKGDVLGWSWLFPPYRWHFDAQVVEATEAIVFNARCVRGKCEQNYELGYQLMQKFSSVIVERLMATRLQLLDFYGSTGDSK